MAFRPPLSIVSPALPVLPRLPDGLALAIPVRVVRGKQAGTVGWLAYGSLEKNGGVLFLDTGRAEETEVDAADCELMSISDYVEM